MMKNPIELIKEELCSRYNLQPEQIQVDVEIWDVESVELADQIKKDHEQPQALTFLKSHKGYNLETKDNSPGHYITGVDVGIGRASIGQITDLTIRTKNGVFKNES